MLIQITGETDDLSMQRFITGNACVRASGKKLKRVGSLQTMFNVGGKETKRKD